MDAITDFVAALAEFSDDELHCLGVAAEGLPNLVSGLRGCLEGTLDWETGRRWGFHYPLRGPMAVIPKQEVAPSIVALGVLISPFLDNPEHDGERIVALLNRVEVMLRMGLKEPKCLH